MRFTNYVHLLNLLNIPYICTEPRTHCPPDQEFSITLCLSYNFEIHSLNNNLLLKQKRNDDILFIFNRMRNVDIFFRCVIERCSELGLLERLELGLLERLELGLLERLELNGQFTFSKATGSNDKQL